MGELRGRVALVTGASRGIGKAVAMELGAAGVHVYVTGRTVEGETPFCQLPGSVDETAAAINTEGGTAVAVRCDHGADEETVAVFDRIRRDSGRLDVLVNNAWAGYQRMQRDLEEALQGPKPRKEMIAGMEGAFGAFTSKFWHLDLDDWDHMHRVGARSHYVASVLATRMMVEAGSGIIVNLTADVSAPGGQVAYGMAKTSVNRMTADMAEQLRDLGVAVLAVQPGMVLTEMFEERYRKGFLSEKDYPRFEAPAFVGRCVVALAGDSEICSKSGSVLETKEIAREYGLPILDGSSVELP